MRASRAPLNTRGYRMSREEFWAAESFACLARRELSSLPFRLSVSASDDPVRTGAAMAAVAVPADFRNARRVVSRSVFSPKVIATSNVEVLEYDWRVSMLWKPSVSYYRSL